MLGRNVGTEGFKENMVENVGMEELEEKMIGKS
jgi:hypothetical protein